MNILEQTIYNFVRPNVKFLNRQEYIIARSMHTGRKRNYDILDADYIRTSELELCAYEINTKKVKGEIAELGVYQGKFARLMTMAFPDRKLYLFDTFEGFDERDIKAQKMELPSCDAKAGDLKGYAAERVLERMPIKKNVIIKKGWFPQSLGGLEEKFCFVSLDADLYNPIYEGLKYFYPRLSKGGYIFVHDYNIKDEGAKRAVMQFSEEANAPYFPMTDSDGTAVFLK